MSSFLLPGSAIPSHVLVGDTFSAGSNFNAAGSMPNNGALTLTPGASVQSIPAGYHNGSGSVPAVVVPAANVLTGTTIAGTAGTMVNRGGNSFSPLSAVAQAIPAGYYNGTGQVNPITTTAGENVFWSSSQDVRGNSGAAQTTYSGTTYAIMCQHTVKYGGAIRIKFTLLSGSASYIAYAQVWKNGVAYGGECSTQNNTTGLLFTQDLTFATGDLMQIYLKNSIGSNWAQITSLSICCNEPAYFV